jgi:hypothetical protein
METPTPLLGAPIMFCGVGGIEDLGDVSIMTSKADLHEPLRRIRLEWIYRSSNDFRPFPEGVRQLYSNRSSIQLVLEYSASLRNQSEVVRTC